MAQVTIVWCCLGGLFPLLYMTLDYALTAIAFFKGPTCHVQQALTTVIHINIKDEYNVTSPMIINVSIFVV